MKTTPSTEERVWAVLAHLSAIAFGMGILLPVIGWSEQRRKSKYVSFQCLQALGYQSLGYTIWVLFALVIIVIQSLKTFSDLLTAVGSGADFERLMSLAMGGHFVVMLGLIGLYVLFPVIAAVACALGRDFHYPIMGNRLANYFGYVLGSEQEWLIEEHEDRWVTAMGHFSVIIMLWGMLVPLTAWILQGKRSLFMKFQFIQTLVYQICLMLLFFGSMFLYVAGAVILLITVGLSGDAGLNATSMIGLVIFFIFMLIIFAIILIVPLFHILGQWAGYRVLKGDDYHYPVIGKLVEKWISNKTPPGTAA